MKLLITGGTGKIGENLIKKLLQSNEIKIRVLVKKKESCFKDSKIEIIKGDLLDSNSLLKATKNIDVVLHLAGITHTNKKELYFKVNTIGTQNLLKVSEKNNVKKFIYISSRVACKQGGEYAQSKLFAEENVQKYKNNWIILQLAEVYGSGGKEAISRLINLIKKSYFIPIIGNGRYLLCPVFIDDVVNVIINSVKYGNIYKKKYVIAGPKEISYINIIDCLVSILKLKRLKIYIPLFIVKFLAYISYILNINFIVRDQIPRLLCKKSINIEAAKIDLNFNPCKFENGIKKIIQE